jgi:guanyl-specific ribonuclease Sa
LGSKAFDECQPVKQERRAGKMQKTGKLRQWYLILWIVVLLVITTGCQSIAGKDPVQAPGQGISASEVEAPAGQTQTGQAANENGSSKVQVTKGQSYSTMAEVASYIHEFRALPPNFITKAEAQILGWDNAKGNLWAVTDHKSIGGDRFGNREGLLPNAAGRQYYECDINYYGGYRGAQRIVYSNDGLVFYSADHYANFRQLY